MKWCVINSNSASCFPGDESNNLFFDPQHPFSGNIVNIVRRIFKTVSNNTMMCVQNLQSSSSCDAVIGGITPKFAIENGWDYSIPYQILEPAVIFKSQFSPWSFLKPFSWELWILLTIISIIIIPGVLSFTEYDTGESILTNCIIYVFDSIHSFFGTDVLRKQLPEYKYCHILSATIAVFACVIGILYSCNLTVNVLSSFLATKSIKNYQKNWWKIYTTPELKPYFPWANDISTQDIHKEIYSKNFDAIISSYDFLNNQYNYGSINALETVTKIPYIVAVKDHVKDFVNECVADYRREIPIFGEISPRTNVAIDFTSLSVIFFVYWATIGLVMISAFFLKTNVIEKVRKRVYGFLEKITSRPLKPSKPPCESIV